jgi:DNA-binding transcriptional LysR family regulator
MRLQQLRQFVMIAETLNFRRAAERLNMAQPPLSISIRKLEAELGAPLFTRGPQGVRLTSEGAAALNDARQALLHADHVVRIVRETGTGERGKLQLGFVGSATYRLLPRLLRAFRRQYPLIDVSLVESRTADLLSNVDSGALDVALVRTPVLQDGRADIVDLETDSLCVAVPKDSRFAQRKSCHLADFKDEPFVIYSRESVPSMHALTMVACQEAGFLPRIAEEAAQLQTILCLVESGLGVALVPGVIAQHTAAVNFVRIAGSAGRTAVALGIVINSVSPSAAAVHFRQFAIKEIQQPR